MVIGGGAAGMSAAAGAAERGHQVTIFERSDRLGGQLHLAGAPPGREEFLGLAHDLARQLSNHGVSVALNQEVNAALLDEVKPDIVVLATGGASIIPPIPGVELRHVVQAWDVLSGNVLTGRRVVVIGGGAVGIETALFLAEKGTLSGEALKFLLVHEAESPDKLYGLAVRGTKEVTVIEVIDELGKNFGKTTRWGMLQDVERLGIRTKTTARALEITSSHVRIESTAGVEEIPADTVVLAVGTKAFNPLQEIVAKKGIPFHVAGDAATPGTVFDAIHQGFAVGAGIN